MHFFHRICKLQGFAFADLETIWPKLIQTEHDSLQGRCEIRFINNSCMLAIVAKTCHWILEKTHAGFANPLLMKKRQVVLY